MTTDILQIMLLSRDSRDFSMAGVKAERNRKSRGINRGQIVLCSLLCPRNLGQCLNIVNACFIKNNLISQSIVETVWNLSKRKRETTEGFKVDE